MNKKRSIVLRVHIDFLVLAAFVVLLLQIVVSPLLFFVPAAVAILASRWRQGPAVALVVLVLQLYLSIHEIEVLDTLMIVLSYLFGFYLWAVLRKKGGFSYLVYPPLLVAFGSAFTVFLLQRHGLSFHDWNAKQLQLSQLTPLQEVGEWPSSSTGDLYQQMVMPFLKRTFLSWFSFVFALVFFINAVLENMARGRRLPTWKSFLEWKSHDLVLVAFVVGLALTAAPQLFPGLPKDCMTWGLHLLLLSLFPILVQGSAVASFFIPRASLFLFIVIFAVLLIEPLPVLLLAGLGDLWFDFRAKLKLERKR